MIKLHAMTLALLLTGGAFGQDDAPRQLSVVESRGVDLPLDWSIDVPGPGLLKLVVLESPQGFALDAQFSGVAASHFHRQAGEAIVTEAGAANVTIGHRWGRSPEGDFRIEALWAPQHDATEPANNDQDGARVIGIGRHHVGIFPKGDVDWLTLEIDEPGYLLITAPESPQGFACWAVVTDHLGRACGTNAARIDFPGTVYIKLTDRWGSFSSMQPIELDFTFVPEFDLLEPNDTPATAVEVEVGRWYVAGLAPPGDQDCFIFEIERGGLLVFETREIGRLQPVWSLANAEGQSISGGPAFVVKPGRYVVTLKERWGAASYEPFHWRCVLKDMSDDLPAVEGEAQAIPLDEWLRVRFIGVSGPRSFHVEIEEPGIYRFETAPQRADNIVFSYALEEDRILTLNPLVLRLQPGRYELTAHAADRRRAAPEEFLIRASSDGSLGPDEGNDRMERAARLEVGAWRDVSLDRPGDDDWFEFTIDEPGAVLWRLVSDEASLHAGWFSRRVSFMLYDPAGEHYFTASPMFEGSVGLVGPVDCPEPGTYHLRVTVSPAEQPRAARLSMMMLDPRESMRDGAEVYVIGLDLDEPTQARLQSLAFLTGAAYVAAERVEEIQPRLEEVVTRATAEPERSDQPHVSPAAVEASRAWLWWIAAPVIVIGGIVIVLLPSRRAAS